MGAVGRVICVADWAIGPQNLGTVFSYLFIDSGSRDRLPADSWPGGDWFYNGYWVPPVMSHPSRHTAE